MRPLRWLSAWVMLLFCVALLPAQPTSQPGDGEDWRVVKTSSGNVKSSQTLVKFMVTTPRWRLTIKTEAKEPRPNSPAEGIIRIALMSESARDQDDKPVNWQQVMIVCDGRPGQSGTQVFESGPTEPGKEKWFALNIVGRNATYEMKAEDQAAADKPKSKSKSKSSSKSKKKKDQ